MSKEELSSFDSLKVQLAEANEEVLRGDHLNTYQKAAKEIVKIERSYFYGERDSYRRLQEIRVVIAESFKNIAKD